MKKKKIIEIEEYPGQGENDMSTMELMRQEYGTWDEHDADYYDNKTSKLHKKKLNRIKAKKMATGGLMSMPPYIAKQDKTSDGITPYDVNTPMSARKGLPSRALDKSRTRFNKGGEAFPDLSGDGDVTQKDILIGKGVIKKAYGGLMRKKYAIGDEVEPIDADDIPELEEADIDDLISRADKVKFKKLEVLKKEGIKLTAKQEKDLAEFKAKDRKVEMAIGGAVTEKYNMQRPEYQAYAEGDIVEDEMPEDEMPVMQELETEEESLLQPMGMNDEMPMDDEEDITDEDLEGMDAIIDTSALSDEEENLLDEAIDMHPELEAIIPKLVATEFTDDGEVEGPGTGTSDSIPALLSDGEFVFTAKAVKNIGVDKLRKMMKQAEESYDAGNQSQEEEEIV